VLVSYGPLAQGFLQKYVFRFAYGGTNFQPIAPGLSLLRSLGGRQEYCAFVYLIF